VNEQLKIEKAESEKRQGVIAGLEKEVTNSKLEKGKNVSELDALIAKVNLI
jgi:hypothetical protein